MKAEMYKLTDTICISDMSISAVYSQRTMNKGEFINAAYVIRVFSDLTSYFFDADQRF